MAAIARTWSMVTTALVHQNTSVTTAPLRTASPMTRVLTMVLVTAMGCAAVHPDTQVLQASQLLSHVTLTTKFVKLGRDITSSSAIVETPR